MDVARAVVEAEQRIRSHVRDSDGAVYAPGDAYAQTKRCLEIIEAAKINDRTDELLSVVVRMADTFAGNLDLEPPSARPEMEPIPVRATVEFSRAVDFEDKGDVDQAIERYRAALEIHPGHAAAKAALERLESSGGER